jgi:hypothetical protein
MELQPMQNNRYTIHTKDSGQPFKCVDLSISATPIAVRSIKAFVGSFTTLVSMAAHKPKITMHNAKRRLEDAIGLWSSGNAFSGPMNPASPSGSPTDESEFGRCQENATCLNA